MTRSRILPMLRIETAAGSDPDVVVVEDFHHDDSDLNDAPLIDFGEYPECPSNPHGTGCHFRDPWDPDAPCIYCKKPGGQ